MHVPPFPFPVRQCTPNRRRTEYTARCRAVNTLTLPSPLDPYLNTIDYAATAACDAAGCVVSWVGGDWDKDGRAVGALVGRWAGARRGPRRQQRPAIACQVIAPLPGNLAHWYVGCCVLTGSPNCTQSAIT